MKLLLLALPLIAFLMLLVVFLGEDKRLRLAFVSAAVAWGSVLFGITEVLSGVNEFGRAGIALGWLAATLFSAVWLWRTTRSFSKEWRSQIITAWKGGRRNNQDIPYGLLAGCALIIIVCGLIALVCPPNTPDSMYYHMVRVVNWLDHRNISYYPNIYLPQSYMPPWAEYAMAHLFALASGDHFVNLVQWFSMCGSCIGVSWIAKMIGAPPRGQVFAAAVCATIPQGILESSGSKNDYVVAFWIVCCVFFLLTFRDRPSRGIAVMIGLSAGLALLTKGTAYIFLPPVALMLFLSFTGDTRLRFLRLSPLIAILALTLNVHQYIRNLDLCHALTGCSTAFSGPIWKFSNDHITAPVIVSNVVRNIALHLGSPSESLNLKMTNWAAAAIKTVGIDPDDLGSTWSGAHFQIPVPMLHEDALGNPIHLLLIYAAIGILLFDGKSRQLNVKFYTAGLIVAFILFCAYLRWQPWHTRLHLPLFVLWSASIGVVFGRRFKLAPIAAVGTVLLMLAMPALLENRLRQVIGPASIFLNDREALYRAPPSYRLVADLADRISCKNAGIDADTGFNEYPLLVFLHAGLGIRDIRQLRVENDSAKYAGRLGPFKPECVICSNCPRNSSRWKVYNSMGMREAPSQELSLFYLASQAWPVERYRLRLRFSPALQARPMPEPLLTFGVFGASDFFYVRYLGDDKVSFGFHHWGTGGPDSMPVTIKPDMDYTADILVDSVGTIEILIDGQPVLDWVSPVYPHPESAVFIGRNPVGGAAAGPAFTGQATRVPAR
jgi:hypothetical protein